MTAIRPRRSVLYMPGANERALEKAKTLPANSLILDLEDAVAPEAKVEARDRVCDVVKAGAMARANSSSASTGRTRNGARPISRPPPTPSPTPSSRPRFERR